MRCRVNWDNGHGHATGECSFVFLHYRSLSLLGLQECRSPTIVNHMARRLLPPLRRASDLQNVLGWRAAPQAKASRFLPKAFIRGNPIVDSNPDFLLFLALAARRNTTDASLVRMGTPLRGSLQLAIPVPPGLASILFTITTETKRELVTEFGHDHHGPSSPQSGKFACRCAEFFHRRGSEILRVLGVSGENQRTRNPAEWARTVCPAVPVNDQASFC